MNPLRRTKTDTEVKTKTKERRGSAMGDCSSGSSADAKKKKKSSRKSLPSDELSMSASHQEKISRVRRHTDVGSLKAMDQQSVVGMLYGGARSGRDDAADRLSSNRRKSSSNSRRASTTTTDRPVIANANSGDWASVSISQLLVRD
jgi:hypothetical protein